MNFDFSDEQKAFGEQLRRMLADLGSLAEARATLEGREPYSAAVWRALAGMGCQAVLVPEAHGGLGLSALDLCVAAEAIGHALAPVPSLPSIYLCAEAIRLYGSAEQQAAWLPRLAEGSAIGTFAVAEGPGEITPGTLATHFAGGRLDGVKLPVPDGAVADVAVVLARGGDGPVLVLAELAGVERESVPNLDPGRPVARLRFADAPAEPLGAAGLAEWERLRDRAAILLAFEQIGAADRALEMARDYALERKSFGRAIGSYQAIKHKLANVYAANQIARAHAYFGAWALATDAPELPLAAAAARVAASEAFSLAAQENVQTHGGIGFTWEHDCQLFYRRARGQALVLGGMAAWKGRILAGLRAGLGERG
jgi:alkylation response protein AidB-like acyl-CoA dehydrogenase